MSPKFIFSFFEVFFFSLRLEVHTYPTVALTLLPHFLCQEDLLERAALVGGQLRETAEGLEVLKHEVSELRESIRSVDVLGKLNLG